MLAEHGLTVADLGDSKSNGTGRRRGRPIGSQNLSTVARKVAKKATAALYVNPETGAKWSGHGRPPAWIVSAPDRAVFLAGAKEASPKKAAAKKTWLKKISAKVGR
ncbi:H-NS histone family protein [Paraburkholderia flagellata]|uniref:H-NS histone family protein n=1 Tax=Paraburkholderia flagellata TaxID=2883241 RepID=UPI0035711692